MKKFVWILLGLTMMVPGTLFAQRSLYMPLSKSSREVRVKISTQKGALRILAWDKKAVKYEVEGGGLVNALEKQNEILIGVKGNEETDLTVYVPRNSHLLVKSFQEGSIFIRGVEGSLTVDAYNGAVKMTEVGGNAVVSAWNGPIFASFKYVNDKPMAFTSYEGEIKLLLPHDTDAKILASYQNGNLINEFAQRGGDAKTEVYEVEVGENRIKEKKWEQLILGRGKPEWRVRNLNGDIKILKW